MPQPLEPLRNLLVDLTPLSMVSEPRFRVYNSGLCIGEHDSYAEDQLLVVGTLTYLIHGSVYCMIGPIRESDGQLSKCL